MASIAKMNCLLVFFLTLIFSSAVQAKPVLRLAANHWEPYTGENLLNDGLASELVVTALNRAGYDVVISIMPWKRVLAEAYNGSVDGVVAIWSTAERKSKLHFSNSYMANEMVLLYMPDLPREPNTLAELSGLSIGIGSGYDYSDDFLSYKNFSVEAVPNTMQNLLKLTMGRVDVVIEDTMITKYAIKKHAYKYPSLNNIIFSKNPALTIPVYFALHPKTKNAEYIIKQFNYEIMKMKEDGTVRKILSNAKAIPP